jgi:hypothetical protein
MSGLPSNLGSRGFPATAGTGLPTPLSILAALPERFVLATSVRPHGRVFSIHARRQAIAIGLSEARTSGAKVPRKKGKRAKRKKSSGRRRKSS